MDKRYYDKNGSRVEADMFHRFSNGRIEKVYATVGGNGNPDLGINASNDAYMERHGIPESERVFYPLSDVELWDAEICEPKEEQGHSMNTMSSM